MAEYKLKGTLRGQLPFDVDRYLDVLLQLKNLDTSDLEDMFLGKRCRDAGTRCVNFEPLIDAYAAATMKLKEVMGEIAENKLPGPVAMEKLLKSVEVKGRTAGAIAFGVVVTEMLHEREQSLSGGNPPSGATEPLND